MPKFAANLSLLFTELPFAERFAAAAAAGFTAVECQFPYDLPAEVVAAQLRQLKLDLVLFNAPPGDWSKGSRGLAVSPQQTDAFRQSISTALDYAARTGTKHLHVMAGITDGDRQSTLGLYRSNLAFAAEHAAAVGVTVLIEPLNQYDMPGYFLSDYDLAAELITAIGMPSLRLQFDLYHRQMICGRIIDGLCQFLPLIGHIQVAGVPGRNEPVGGELDFAAIFAEIDRLGYQGFIGCEYRPLQGTVPGLAWIKPHMAAASQTRA
ncbi:MAG TPA: TIM barrel protein [Terriglobales bacterium]|nr:TIM barrel protein [Terriglobales bacterium]